MSLLSILVPTRNRADLLAACLDSLLATTVPAEIVIADNASEDETSEVIQRYLERDSRIRSWRNPRDVGIHQNINDLYAAAKGDYLCLFTDDDIALPGCFETKVAILERLPSIGVVYSLWERIDAEGNVLGVIKWPGLLDYSYLGGRDEFADMLIASYFTVQAAVTRRSLYDQHGALDPAIQVTADWDMLLRWLRGTSTAFLHTPTCQIRSHAGSYTETVGRLSGLNALNKLAIWRKWLIETPDPPVLEPVTWDRMAASLMGDVRWHYGDDQSQLDRHLAMLSDLLKTYVRLVDGRCRSFVSALASEAIPRVPAEPAATSPEEVVRSVATADAPWQGEGIFPSFATSDPPPLCSIVIPVFNRVTLTAQCLESVARTTVGMQVEVIVVDNGSTDETAELLRRQGVRVITNAQNRGFSCACNQGAAVAQGASILFLNNDTIAQPGWLGPLLEVFAAHPEVVAVGPCLLYPDGRLQHAGVESVERAWRNTRWSFGTGSGAA